MISFPNGKINIGLSITEKRTDGYHNLETIMYPVKINDILEIIVAPEKEFIFNSTGLKIPGQPENNLICKAFEILKTDYDLPPVNIHLHKIIPTGSGLGGGSSDGAFALKMINSLFNLGLTFPEMEKYARMLGSDCAFFIHNKPTLSTGRGDQFEKIIDIDIEKKHLVLVKPEVHINTQTAYSWIKPEKKKIPLKHLVGLPLDQWKNNIINDFEPEVVKRFPVINTIKDRLYRLGAVYASLTGSGSAVYGIFDDARDIQSAFPDCFVWCDIH